MRIRFGECILDTGSRQLHRASREVHLSPKAFELLQLLVDERPRAVARQELLDRVWHGVFVSDSSLARVVSEVRDAIGDPASAPRFLRTVHAFGYSFGGDAAADPPEPLRAPCWLVLDDRHIALDEGEQTIGRDPDTKVCLKSPRVSRRHARLTVDGTQATIEDLGSKNGTFVSGERLEGPRVLKPGDRVRIGPFSLMFGAAGPSRSTETEVAR